MLMNEMRALVEPTVHEAGATNSCIVYEFDLPPSCEPNRCRFGFENHEGNGVVMIDEGISYSGDNDSFRMFVNQGEFLYRNEEELNEFLSLLDSVTAEGARLHPGEESDGAADQEPSSSPQRVEPIRSFDVDEYTSKLKENIRGQDTAIETTAEILRSAVRKCHPARPPALLFAGPSGVGKTSMGMHIAEAINCATGANFDVLRVDMNQLSERYATSRLYGAPPGYIGYDDPPLFAKLTQNPRQIVLFDELEKANPRVLFDLMNAMAEGRLESSKLLEDGTRTFDFRYSILVFTTNIPFDVEKGLSAQETTRECRRQLGSYADGYVSFPPEIINRFSEIVVFEPLSGEAKRAIAELSLMRLAAQFGLEVESISPGAVDFLLSHCSEENEARSYEYAAERLFGKFLAEYDEGSLIRIGRNACGPRQIFVQSVSARDEE